MFWKQARAKYGKITAEDEDVRKFLELSDKFQKDVYLGLAGKIQDIGHRWVANRSRGKTLEIGFGTGRHALFYKGMPKNYFVSEYIRRHLVAKEIREYVRLAVCCDARRLPYQSNSFETIISIYNLEHIADLDSVLSEAHRALVPFGRFLIALPCEGGFFWNIGRELTTRPMFQKKYGINYDKVLAYEHVWNYSGIFEKIVKSDLFRVEEKKMFPFIIPLHNFNLVACLSCLVVK
jgi:SAM-dependent methyltransferase